MSGHPIQSFKCPSWNIFIHLDQYSCWIDTFYTWYLFLVLILRNTKSNLEKVYMNKVYNNGKSGALISISAVICEKGRIVPPLGISGNRPNNQSYHRKVKRQSTLHAINITSPTILLRTGLEVRCVSFVGWKEGVWVCVCAWYNAIYRLVVDEVK